MTRSQRVTLVFILLAAAVLRLTGLDWDGFQHHHPDERYITWVATTIEFPSFNTIGQAATWQPQTATFNPFHWPPGASSEGIVVLQGKSRDFAYGHVPLYLGVLATRLMERVAPPLASLLPREWGLVSDILNIEGQIEFHHLTAVSRALTALFDVGTVLFTFLIGRRLYNPATGLMAAALLGLTVLHIQLAHFFTSDPYMTFFVTAALFFMVEAKASGESDGQGGRTKLFLALAGAMTGLAVGSKFSAILLLLPLLWTVWNVSPRPRRWLGLIVGTGTALVVFAVTNPFAILDWTCFPTGNDPGGVMGLLSRSCYLQNVLTQNAMVRGTIDIGFTRQYSGTLPYLYFAEMLLRWGMGPFLGLLGMMGLGWAIWKIARSLHAYSGWRDALAYLKTLPEVIILLWVLPYILLTGSFFVKFLRYTQPVVPFLLLFGAAMIFQWRSHLWRRATVALVLVGGAIYAVAFSTIYTQEHPWNAASRWMYETIPPGTLVLSEQWDDYLPVNMVVNGQQRRREEYPNDELTWLTYPDEADTEGRLMANLEKLATAEYVTIISNRVYGVVPRLDNRFPLSGQFHHMLFNGSLGYELVWVGGRYPELFGVSILPDTFTWPRLRPPEGVVDYLQAKPRLVLGRADESFIVYDQPLTMIFQNTGNMTAGQMREQFDLPDGLDAP